MKIEKTPGGSLPFGQHRCGLQQCPRQNHRQSNTWRIVFTAPHEVKVPCNVNPVGIANFHFQFPIATINHMYIYMHIYIYAYICIYTWYFGITNKLMEYPQNSDSNYYQISYPLCVINWGCSKMLG